MRLFIEVGEQNVASTQLLDLIKQHNIPDELLNKWCNKAQVSSIYWLDDSKQKACIDHIIDNYVRNVA